MIYREMTMDDYDGALSLWMELEGVRLRDADSPEGIARYLDRNPRLSLVAEVDGVIVGTIMAGHDGKRGYIQHLAVSQSQRRVGIASALVERCLAALARVGILKSHVMILNTNEVGKRFWSEMGWQQRDDVELYSFINGGTENT